MRLGLSLALSFWVACGGDARQRSAAVTAGEWARAARAGDREAAYALLADPVRRRVSADEFARRWRAAEVERERQAAALGEALRAGATLGERARIGDGPSHLVTLTREPEGWRLETPLVPAPGARTPEEALRQLADAIDDRSLAGVLRLLTSERQDGVRQTLDGFASGLRAHLGESIEITADRATLVWTEDGKRWRVVLKREAGTWRIDDFSQQ
jgi:hypothetical protein